MIYLEDILLNETFMLQGLEEEFMDVVADNFHLCWRGDKWHGKKGLISAQAETILVLLCFVEEWKLKKLRKIYVDLYWWYSKYSLIRADCLYAKKNYWVAERNWLLVLFGLFSRVHFLFLYMMSWVCLSGFLSCHTQLMLRFSWERDTHVWLHYALFKSMNVESDFMNHF